MGANSIMLVLQVIVRFPLGRRDDRDHFHLEVGMNSRLIGPKASQLINLSRRQVHPVIPVAIPAFFPISRIIREGVNQAQQPPARHPALMPVMDINPPEKEISFDLAGELSHIDDSINYFGSA